MPMIDSNVGLAISCRLKNHERRILMAKKKDKKKSGKKKSKKK